MAFEREVAEGGRRIKLGDSCGVISRKRKGEY